MISSTRHILVAALAAAAVIVALIAAQPARAGILVDSARDCDDPQLERAFERWLDPAQYFLVPGGSFAGGAPGWQRDDARVVDDNEPWNVHGDDRPGALQISAGGSATTPAVCVGLAEPTTRFFARDEGGLLSLLSVEVLFEGPGGAVLSLPIGVVSGTQSWQPTLPMALVANLLPLLPGDKTAVALRFTAVGGDWVIDDVYVDPYKKG